MKWLGTGSTEFCPAGGWLSSAYPGFGALGADILADTATGDAGHGYLYNDIEAGDEAKEICGKITRMPTGGVLVVQENGVFTYTGPPDSFEYQLYVDSVATGSPATVLLGATPTQVQSDIYAQYSIRGVVGNDLSAAFSIRGSVSTDITPAYSIMSATVSPTLVQPNADTTTGGWISSTASSLSSCIDETIPSDTDFISYTTPAAAQSFISTNSGSLIINPAAKSQFGLTSVWTGTNPDVELIKNSRTDISATTLRSIGKAGPAIRFTNAPEIVKIGETKDIISSTAASILVLRRCLDTTNRQSTVFTANTVNTSRCSVHVPWSDGTIYFDFGDFNHGEGRVTYTGYVKDLNWEVLVFTAGPVDNLTIWRRGVRLARNAAAPVYRNPVNVPFGLGGNSGDAPSDITETALCITSNTEWSPAQVKSLSENPWQIFSKTAKPVIITAGGPTCEMVLAESAFPGGVNQVLKYRASSTTASTLTVTLKQGSTTIMTRTHTLSGTITEYSDTLTSGEIAAITSGPISVTLGCS